MEYIEKLQNTTWNANNISKVVVVILLLGCIISLIPKKSFTRQFAASIIKEMRTVEWLKGKELLLLTFIVIVVSVIAIIIMTPLDALFVNLKNQYLFN